MNREELIIAEAALQDVVSDAETLIESLNALSETLINENTRDRFLGWAVCVDAIRNDAHRISCSLSVHIDNT